MAAMSRSARAELVKRFTVHDGRIHVEPKIDPGAAARAHRDALLVVRHPSTNLMTEQPGSFSDRPDRLPTLHRRRQLREPLILRDGPVPGGDRPVSGADRDHPDLVGTRLRANLRSPLLRIDTLRGTHLTPPKQLCIIAARPLEIVLSDAPEPLLMLRRHATSR